MAMIRSELCRRRVVWQVWAPDGWSGLRRGMNETSIPPTHRPCGRLSGLVAY